MNLYGKAWKFGDKVDTGQVIPAHYLVTSNPKELGQHSIEDADPEPRWRSRRRGLPR